MCDEVGKDNKHEAEALRYLRMSAESGFKAAHMLFGVLLIKRANSSAEVDEGLRHIHEGRKKGEVIHSEHCGMIFMSWWRRSAYEKLKQDYESCSERKQIYCRSTPILQFYHEYLTFFKRV